MFKFIRDVPITLSIALIAVFAFLFPETACCLELNTTVRLSHQIPQLFGCHLLHWSLDHFGWDLFMFVLVGVICERKDSRSYAWVLFVSALLIPVSVVATAPQLGSYRGLSGIDTAMFAFAAVLLIVEAWRQMNRHAVLLYGGLLAGLTGKTVYELTIAGTLFVSSANFVPVPIAHLVGIAVGVVLAVSLSIDLYSNYRDPTNEYGGQLK